MDGDGEVRVREESTVLYCTVCTVYCTVLYCMYSALYLCWFQGIDEEK